MPCGKYEHVVYYVATKMISLSIFPIIRSVVISVCSNLKILVTKFEFYRS
jgi:hypothetical protein